MDRFSPPSLIVPVISAIFAAVFMALGYKMPADGAGRLLCVGIGVILLLVAFVTGGNWLWYNVNQRRIEGSVHLRYAQLVSIMNSKQLEMLSYISPFIVHKRLMTKSGVVGLEAYLETPQGLIPYDWLENYLIQCRETYPEMIPQHGKSDSLDRQYVRWLVKLLNDNELITPSIGNQPPKWRFPLTDILRMLELTV